MMHDYTGVRGSRGRQDSENGLIFISFATTDNTYVRFATNHEFSIKRFSARYSERSEISVCRRFFGQQTPSDSNVRLSENASIDSAPKTSFRVYSEISFLKTE